MGSNKRSVAWCVGLLVVGLLLATAAGRDSEPARLINDKHRQDAAAVEVQLGAMTVAGVVPDCFKVCHNSKDHDACMRKCQGRLLNQKRRQEATAVHVQLGEARVAAAVLAQAAAEEARRVTREMTCSEFCVRNAWRFPGKYSGCMVWCEENPHVTKQINNNVDKHRADGVSSFAK
uniref:Uncharacterized protein n=1 Tax=Aegilops tauschii TaxID=37682 RepID=R7WAR6_AEGTA